MLDKPISGNPNNDVKELWYFLTYCLLHTKSSEKSKSTALTLFKALYSKIKYCLFLKDQDYEIVIEWLRNQTKKLVPEFKSERICLIDNFDSEVSEYYSIEKVGSEWSYDARIGNRFTRRTFVKEIYNEFYDKYSPKKYAKTLDGKSVIRSQDHNEGKFTF